MKERIKILENTVERTEREKIKNGIIITGIEQQDKKNEDINDIVIKVAQGLNIKIDKTDITESYRRNTKNENSPIIVQFKTKETKDNIINARKTVGSIKTIECQLKGGNNEVYINEQLTALETNLFYHARTIKKEKKYKYVWTREGNIYLKKTDSSEKIKIKSHDDLLNIE